MTGGGMGRSGDRAHAAALWGGRVMSGGPGGWVAGSAGSVGARVAALAEVRR
jgi:hypothetical protein